MEKNAVNPSAYLCQNVKIWAQQYEVLSGLPDKLRGKLLWALVRYGMEGILPDFDTKEEAKTDSGFKNMPPQAEIAVLKSLWTAMKYSTEKSRNISIERANSGSKGGKASKQNNPSGRRGKTPSDETATPEMTTTHNKLRRRDENVNGE